MTRPVEPVRYPFEDRSRRSRAAGPREVVIDTSGIGWRLVATAFFVLMNGFFVAAEFALVKVRASRVRILAEGGSARARLVEHLLGHLDLYLSACQLGITLASLILGWLAEPAVAVGIQALAGMAGWSIAPGALHVVSLALALTIVTLLHMVIGEQAPKIWAIHRSETMALRVAYPLRVFAAIFKPFIWVINKLSNLLLRGLGMDPGISPEGTPDASEIRSILARSAQAGYITGRQRIFAQNILEIADMEVRHILVPRGDIVHLSLELPMADNLRLIRESGHSRFPLSRNGGLDEILGIVHAKAVLNALVDQQEVDLEGLARHAVYVPDTQPVSRMILELQQTQSGCAVVVDEHGTHLGMAFLDDALEEIVGPIHDEFDERETKIRRVSPKVVEMAGNLAYPEARQVLALDDDSDEDTIGGHVISVMGKFPKRGDQVKLGSWLATVLNVRSHRVLRLRFETVPDESAEAG